MSDEPVVDVVQRTVVLVCPFCNPSHAEWAAGFTRIVVTSTGCPEPGHSPPVTAPLDNGMEPV